MKTATQQFTPIVPVRQIPSIYDQYVDFGELSRDCFSERRASHIVSERRYSRAYDSPEVYLFDKYKRLSSTIRSDTKIKSELDILSSFKTLNAFTFVELEDWYCHAFINSKKLLSQYGLKGRKRIENLVSRLDDGFLPDPDLFDLTKNYESSTFTNSWYKERVNQVFNFQLFRDLCESKRNGDLLRGIYLDTLTCDENDLSTNGVIRYLRRIDLLPVSDGCERSQIERCSIDVKNSHERYLVGKNLTI